MSNQFFSPKTVDEIVPLTFDFSNLTDAVTSVVSITPTVVKGVDATPGNTLSGAAQIQGASAIQLFTGGVSGVTYALRCLVAAGDEQYELTGQINVT